MKFGYKIEPMAQFCSWLKTIEHIGFGEVDRKVKGLVIGVERRKSGVVVAIFAVLTVVALVLVVILRNVMNRNEGEEMDVSKYADRGITKAYMIPDEDGELEAYDVFVTVPGYKSDIETKVRIEKDGDELLDLQILSQDETPELGGKIMEGSFLNQFKGKELPIGLSGQTDGNGAEKAIEGSLALSGTGNAGNVQPGPDGTEGNESQQEAGNENTAAGNLGEAVQRMDGVYQAEGEESGGYKSKVTMVITNGEITEVLWDSFDAAGNGKRELSIKGEYIMTEDGLIWADQADAVQNYVIEHQSLSGLVTDDQGKTDAVSGVSISIAEFKELLNNCLMQATGGAGTDEGDSAGNGENQKPQGNNGEGQESTIAVSEVDGVSGATISSQAVVTAVQTAYEFVLEQGQ